MYKLYTKNIELTIDEENGAITSLKLKSREVCVDKTPIFKARLRNKNGDCFYISALDARVTSKLDNALIYQGFDGDFSELVFKVTVRTDSDKILWQIEAQNTNAEYAIEWIEFPKISLPRLIDNNENGGKILFPYDEGIIVTDEAILPRYEMEFPMSGAHFIFPNKLCSQFMAYLFDDMSLYIGAHDTKRAFKGIDFYPEGNGVSMQIRLYSGVDYGESFKMDYPIVWQACEKGWKAPATIYREWLENNLPKNLIKIAENKTLPSWYERNPLIVTYPVRGIHDMDKMEPNALFPYTNALPILDKIKSNTGCQIMALLMHWEGTAPWAPPYTWPPFGGVELFNEFKSALHKNGDLIGVYCSGFGYTSQSTLIESYNTEDEIQKRGVTRGVCHSPQNKPELGITCCPYQRYGYDICPASKLGREILDEAYAPLFEADIDYIQILDQNHGGGQYMCYAREHGHPSMPGEWMTTNMQDLLADWSKKAPNTIFGCESGASEPFIGNLLMSDNRFELNYAYGTPTPVYAYIYHEYVRNFMGNQCGCPFETSIDTLRYRLAYSFSIGDIMTLTLAPNGELMTHWGTHDFEHAPNMEKAMAFIKNLMRFYSEDAKEYLYLGKMSNSADIKCDEIKMPMFRGRDHALLPRLLSSCWEAGNGKIAYIVVNPEEAPVEFYIENERYEAPPLDAILIIK